MTDEQTEAQEGRVIGPRPHTHTQSMRVKHRATRLDSACSSSTAPGLTLTRPQTESREQSGSPRGGARTLQVAVPAGSHAVPGPKEARSAWRQCPALATENR